jgi:hypothetical protein
VRLQLADAADVDDRRTVDALEIGGIEPFLELLHRRPHHVRAPLGVHAHVVAGGIHPLDRGDRQADGLASEPDRQHLRETARDAFGAAGEQFLGVELPGAGDACQQRDELFTVLDGLALRKLVAYVRHGALEPLVHQRLQQVIERMRVECLDRITVECRDEHHHRHAGLWNPAQHLEAVHARHLDVEEHQVG